MINRIPPVKNEIEVQVLNHTFKFRRLRWQDMTKVNEWIVQHKMQEKLAIPACGLFEVSGRAITPDEALKILTTIPRPALDTLYKFYKGSMDPHRMFNSAPLYSAPDALDYSQSLAEEEGESDKAVDELEDYLTQKFGHKEVQEELEMGRRIVAGTGLAGAVSREQDYLASVQGKLNEEEPW